MILEFDITKVELSDLIQAFGVIVAAIIPLVVLWVSTRTQRKQHNESMIQQTNQFNEQQRITKRYYEKQIAQQDEGIRATYMPFLRLDTKAEFGMRDERLIVRLFLENLGNGTAFKVRPVCFSETGAELLHVCDALTVAGEIPCRYSNPFSNDIIPIHSISSFELLLDYVPILNCGEVDSLGLSGEFDFKVKYADALKNIYEQGFFFQFSDSIVVRVESHMPELVTG